MTVNVLKMNINHFTRKTNSIHLNCYSSGVSIVRTDYHSHALKLIRLICYVIYNFYTLDSLKPG
jgi:hypothetical protein